MELSATDLAELLGAAFAILVVPGPSVLYVVTRGVAAGRRDGLVAAAAVGLGLLVQVLAVAAGLGTLVSRSDTAEVVVRAVGAAILVVLGVRAYRSRHELAARASGAGPDRSGAGVLRDGFVVGALNPKRLLVLVALLPQFADGGGAPVAVQILLLGTLVAGVALVCDVGWALVAAAAGERLRSSRRRLERLGAAAGVVMIALAVRLALTI